MMGGGTYEVSCTTSVFTQLCCFIWCTEVTRDFQKFTLTITRNKRISESGQLIGWKSVDIITQGTGFWKQGIQQNRKIHCKDLDWILLNSQQYCSIHFLAKVCETPTACGGRVEGLNGCVIPSASRKTS